MANSSPLAGLLDRAGKVFALADKLGRAFHEEHQGHIDPTGWSRHAETFDEFCTAILELRDAIQNPPDGFAPVAKPLLEAARVAKAIRESSNRPDGRAWADYLEFFPQLNSVCADGWRAVKEVTDARRLDDPFAFVDEPATKPAFTLLDRFPATPAGHVGFLESVRDEVHYVAEAKRQQLERGYPNATIQSMVGGIKWAEARQRVSMLADLPADTLQQVARVLQRELTVGTVEQIASLLGPAVRGLRDAWEGSHGAGAIGGGTANSVDTRIEKLMDRCTRLNEANLRARLRLVFLPYRAIGPEDFAKGEQVRVAFPRAGNMGGMPAGIGYKRTANGLYLPVSLDHTCSVPEGVVIFPAEALQGYSERDCWGASRVEYDADPKSRHGLLLFLLWPAAGDKPAADLFSELAAESGRLYQMLPAALAPIHGVSSPRNLWATVLYAWLRGTSWVSEGNGFKYIALPFAASAELWRRLLYGTTPDGRIDTSAASGAVRGVVAKPSAETNTAAGQDEPQPVGERGSETPIGFLGGAELADCLGVHESRRQAFERRLARERLTLGDENWQEVANPPPNRPRFLYRVNSDKLRSIAADYQKPKPA